MARPAADVKARLARVEDAIGYRFADPAHLIEALTHGSAARRGRQAARNNQRLEFLGDRVLGLVVADILYQEFVDEEEGALSRRHAALVRREALAEIAAELGLGAWLVMARGEQEGGGRSNPAILADALEALLGALYLDGGLAAAQGFVQRFWRPRLGRMGPPPRDAKTSLQEWAQSRGLGLPRYEVVSAEGPAHAPSFEVTVALAGHAPVRASAGSKRAAEQAAADLLLARLTAPAPPADGAPS